MGSDPISDLEEIQLRLSIRRAHNGGGDRENSVRMSKSPGNGPESPPHAHGEAPRCPTCGIPLTAYTGSLLWICDSGKHSRSAWKMASDQGKYKARRRRRI